MGQGKGARHSCEILTYKGFECLYINAQPDNALAHAASNFLAFTVTLSLSLSAYQLRQGNEESCPELGSCSFGDTKLLCHEIVTRTIQLGVCQFLGLIALFLRDLHTNERPRMSCAVMLQPCLVS